MAGWDDARRAADDLKMRTAGANLLRHLTLMYAERKMTAKDFCVACFYASEANVPGADFKRFGIAPGQSTGNYQKAIDRAMPMTMPLYELEVPIMPRGQIQRQPRKCP